MCLQECKIIIIYIHSKTVWKSSHFVKFCEIFSVLSNIFEAIEAEELIWNVTKQFFKGMLWESMQKYGNENVLIKLHCYWFMETDFEWTSICGYCFNGSIQGVWM